MKQKKLIYILPIIILFTFINVTALQVCFNNTDNVVSCSNFDNNIFPQNINLWEGQNDNYDLYIENPAILSPFKQLIKNNFDTQKVDVSELSDEWKFTFQNYNDFYNIVQQGNALGNVSLFTQSDLNKELRSRTSYLTEQVLGYTVTLMVVMIELFKILLALISVIIMIYLFFRLLPWAFKHINTIMVKFALRGNQK